MKKVIKKIFSFIGAIKDSFKYRYQGFNSSVEKEDYAEKFAKANRKTKKISKANQIVEIVKDLKEKGLSHLSDNLYDLVEYDKEKETDRPKVNVDFYNYLQLLAFTWTQLNRDDIDKEDEVEVLKFFGFIRYNKERVTDKDIEDAYMEHRYVRNVAKEFTEEEETQPSWMSRKLFRKQSNNKSAHASFTQLLYNMKNSGVILGYIYRGVTKNDLGNKLHMFSIKLTDDRVINIAIPFRDKGFYYLGSNKIHVRRPFRNSHNVIEDQLRMRLREVLRISRSYPDLSPFVLEKLLQRKVFEMFFSPSVIKPLSYEVNRELTQPGAASYEETMARMTIYWVNATLIEHKGMKANKLKEVIALLEEQIVKTGFSESTIDSVIRLRHFGNKATGIGFYGSFPLDIELALHYDFSIGTSSGDKLYNYLGEDKTPMALYNGIADFYNKRTKRIHLMAAQIAKAFKMKEQHHLITTYKKSPVDFEIPLVNMFVAWDTSININGLTTSADVSLVSPKVARRFGIKNNYKSVTDGLLKSTNRVINTDFYFYDKDGNRHELTFVSPTGLHSRQNFGSLITSLYNMKKYNEGKADVTEERDIEKDPIKESELAGLVKVYFEDEEGNETLYGERYVGLSAFYFVNKAESTFNSKQHKPFVKLGREVRNRLSLMNAVYLLKELYGDPIDSQMRAHKIAQDFPSLANGKNGLATKEYDAYLDGVYTTATLNIDLAYDRARIYISLKDFKKYLRLNNIRGDEQKPYIERFVKGEYSSDQLQMRFPNMDDAGLAYVKLEFIYVKDTEFYDTAYIEVSLPVWVRMGGDADGDLVFMVPIKDPNAIKDAKEFFSYENFKQESNFEDTMFVERNKLKEDYKNLQEFLHFIAKVKRRDLTAKGITVKEMLTPMTVEELKKKLATSVLTIRISKDMIGKAKAPTMKMLDQFNTAILITENSIYGSGKYISQETKDRIRKVADDHNYFYSQEAIEIEKWDEEIRKVFKTAIMIELYAEFMTIVLDARVAQTRSFMSIVKRIIPEAYHTLHEDALLVAVDQMKEQVLNRKEITVKDTINKELFKILNKVVPIQTLYDVVHVKDNNGKWVPTDQLTLKMNYNIETIDGADIERILNFIEIGSPLHKKIDDLAELVLQDFNEEVFNTK